METDKIPRETSMPQAPIENQPIYKNLLNQKGSFLLILGAVIIILVILGIGGYFLIQKQNTEIPSSKPADITQKVLPKNNIFVYTRCFNGERQVNSCKLYASSLKQPQEQLVYSFDFQEIKKADYKYDGALSGFDVMLQPF